VGGDVPQREGRGREQERAKITQRKGGKEQERAEIRPIGDTEVSKLCTLIRHIGFTYIEEGPPQILHFHKRYEQLHAIK
jgi:hypothetical protein